MSNNRSWTWLDEDTITEEQIAERKPAIDALMFRWNMLNNAQEERGFRAQDEAESGEYRGPDFESDAEMRGFNMRRKVERELEQAQVEAIESKLSELGARVSRPYEHWNEDERLMEWQERER